MRSLPHAPRNHHLRGTHGKGTSLKKGRSRTIPRLHQQPAPRLRAYKQNSTFCMQATKSLVPIPQFRTDQMDKRRACSAHGWHAFSKWRVSISSMMFPHLDHSTNHQVTISQMVSATVMNRSNKLFDHFTNSMSPQRDAFSEPITKIRLTVPRSSTRVQRSLNVT
jgi:hypothetical protein